MKIKYLMNEKSQALRESDLFSRQVKGSNVEAETAPCHVQVINLQVFVYVIPVHARHIPEYQSIIFPEKKCVQKFIFCSNI